jgi:hypothetical protein
VKVKVEALAPESGIHAVTGFSRRSQVLTWSRPERRVDADHPSCQTAASTVTPHFDVRPAVVDEWPRFVAAALVVGPGAGKRLTYADSVAFFTALGIPAPEVTVVVLVVDALEAGATNTSPTSARTPGTADRGRRQSRRPPGLGGQYARSNAVTTANPSSG